MLRSAPGLRGRAPESSDLDSLDAMARLAWHLGSVVHVVVPRVPRAAERARAAADAAGVSVDIDLRPNTLRARFVPR